jgi:hypothetical protein
MSDPLDSEGPPHPHTPPRTVCSAIGANLEALEPEEEKMIKLDIIYGLKIDERGCKLVIRVNRSAQNFAHTSAHLSYISAAASDTF